MKKFITHIRFPNFKNIRRNARIEFKYPITALVGVNGSGKSSVMQALQGAPLRRSVSSFWFSTALDPIVVEKQDDPPRFIFGHWHTGLKDFVETRKARVPKTRVIDGKEYFNPDYWEPTKEVVEDNMTIGGRGQTKATGRASDRWFPPSMPVFYTNFRSEISAFDKFLYFASLKETTKLKSKQDRLRAWAGLLQPLLKRKRGGLVRVRANSKNALHAHFMLTGDELAAVSYILGKEYISARYMEHSLYGGQRGVGIYFTNKQGKKYSEAFAGSGEMAVASLVTRLLREAKNPSLVLLDEPEVSLHPGAQRRLLAFLMSQVKKRKHQIVYSTHSASLIRDLPPEAIVLFDETPTGEFDVLQDIEAKTVFGYIGEPLKEKIRIYVEDALAKRLVQWVLTQKFSAPEANRFFVTFLPGGSQTYFASRVATWMMDPDGDPLYLLLDGDQRPPGGLKDPEEVAPAELRKNIDATIKRATRVDKPHYGADGGSDPNAADKLFELKKTYLRFLINRVAYLPRSCPEEIILTGLGVVAPTVSQDAKDALRTHLDSFGAPTTSEEGDLIAFGLFAREQAGKPSADVDAIAALLRSYLDAKL